MHYLYIFFIFQGLYDIHIQMQGVPIMAWDAPPLSNNIYASEVSFNFHILGLHSDEAAETCGYAYQALIGIGMSIWRHTNAHTQTCTDTPVHKHMSTHALTPHHARMQLQ